MPIIRNEPCPACQENGHDKSGDHLIVFDDNARYCSRAHFHTSGQPLYIAPDGDDPVLTARLDGTTKFTIDQYKALEAEGRISSDTVRAVVLGGMRQKEAWELMTPDEQSKLEGEWAMEMLLFSTLKVKNLISRHIKGQYAKLYDIRVGVDSSGDIVRHYYPIYINHNLVGAKCRTLPKDFRSGRLGRTWGKTDLFGMQTCQQVMDTGRRKDTLMVCGGELDAPAAQQMLVESQAGTKYANTLFHVWSVTKGEACLDEILSNKGAINQFKRIIWAFDADEVGLQMSRKCARLFPEKSFIMKYPNGCKDANQCLMTGNAVGFVDGWWNPADPHEGSRVKSIAQIADELKAGAPAMGKSWPWPSLNKMTLGKRDHQLYVVGAGSGVGKTEVLREIVEHGMRNWDEKFGIISTEDPPIKVARSYIGKFIDKKIELPPTNDPEHADYRKLLDYTREMADDAIDRVAETNRMFIADLEGDYSITAVMEQVEEFYQRGIHNILIDNLTGITLPSGKSKVEALDEAVKSMGVYKDTKPVSIFLVTHLSRPKDPRTPHEEGGEVRLSDFRGSGSIGFWASYAIAPERNTRAETEEERCVTYLAIVKDRDQGIFTGQKVIIVGNTDTGRLLEPRDHKPRSKSVTRETKKAKPLKSAEEPLSGESETVKEF